MRAIKCCYCGKKIEIKNGAIQHAITKKNLCLICMSQSLAGFLVGIAPFIHEHPADKEVKR
jgi:hypothetical protein